MVENAPKAIAVACDVGKESDIKNMIDTAVQEFGRVDVIFNNAGISGLLHSLNCRNAYTDFVLF